METNQEIDLTINHLFRQESGKMVSVLVKIFGSENFELVEDVVQDALLSALETWKFRGKPQNPKSWLYKAAKNKAIDIIRREKHHQNIDFGDPDRKLLTSEYSLALTMEELWKDSKIKDDFLGMMYACCHPALSEENQITFILKALCGFSTKEIAKAFLTEDQTISKRLYRTKAFFRNSKLKPAIPPPEELPSRTQAVLETIYMIFNEGYKSTHSDRLIREDLIAQAMFLCKSLIDNNKAQLAEPFALISLMCFHAARSPARISKSGNLIPLEKQDRSKWNRSLIYEGNKYLNKAAFGQEISHYHLEAAIAYEHCIAPNYSSTNWKAIVNYYDALLSRNPDPVISLNRCLAVMEADGPEKALGVWEKLKQEKILEQYYLYYAAEGEINNRLGNKEKAIAAFNQAQKLTLSENEKRFLMDKIADIQI
ncbi:sigma-70 family RNA polymerase sigma factor [Echinicola jeungdonensis]|uniref:RNA polymerase sigma factor n=1 Tax=Echinicola jeungdonensis TaxID=709343 RepID=A0ABV5J8K2_9BACT|nr:sigma-70 family RNA polymerase sigma factor [Echinicola jeungdonensis]MDN3669399.1 sigma-70 family RNA polymerase sigma factor [Echinicola jeungdonensis]